MDKFGSAPNLISISPSLPKRRGKRPATIRGPLHVQCLDHGDDRALHHLIDKVTAWPNVEAGPLPVGSADLVSFQVGEDVATDDPSVFITGREFGRVLFNAPTIYLTLPLSCAHWAVVRGWAEPHFSSSFGLVPPGVMVVYTPRDEHEAAVSIAVLGLLQLLPERDEQELWGLGALVWRRASPQYSGTNRNGAVETN